MLQNYLKIAFRNLWKHRLFSFINIFGLALSLSVCMMVMLMTKDHLSYDLFHPHPERTYRIISDVRQSKDNNEYVLASTPLPLNTVLKDKPDIVEASVRIYPALNGKAVNGNTEIYIRGAFAETDFFTVFGFNLSAGNELTALQSTNSIVLSSETASKIFGKRNALGKTLDMGKLGIFQVTGILNKPAGKSHIDFDAYVSSAAITPLEKTGVLPAKSDKWYSFQDSYTYVLLKDNVRSASLESALKQTSALLNKDSKEGSVNFHLQTLRSITPGSGYIFNEIGRGTTWSKLLVEVGVAFIILLAACFNYTNLTIARALTRAKEVGVRKVSGASRYQIFVQYIVESLIMAGLALGFAYFILLQILRYKPFNDGYEMVPDVNIDLSLFISFLAFTVFAGLLAGALPAWILSSFKPVKVLKSISTEKLFGNLSLQKTLLVFQYSLSLLIIIFLSAFYRQFSYLSTVDPGFATKNILSVPFSGSGKVFQNEISKISGVGKISAASDNFGSRGSGQVVVFPLKSVSNRAINTDQYFTDATSVDVMELGLIAGTTFPDKVGSETEKYILINERASVLYGFKDAASSIGKVVWVNDSIEVEIKGVVKDFYHGGVARNITPLVLRNLPENYAYLHIQVASKGRDNAINQIASVWNKLNPHNPFTYEWLEEKVAIRQTATYSLLGFLAFITISIASLGLLGLVIYTVETRSKEISIRKVIGASVNQLMILLSKGFIKLLVIAGLIAMPLGYLLSYIFLQNFPTKAPFGIGILLLCFGFLLLIGLITIITNTFRASSQNPVKNLRME